MDDVVMKGRCACGSVAYRMVSRPIVVNCCHCRSCQRQSGAAFALNAMIEAERVVVTAGAPEIVLTPSEGGQGQKIARCPECRVSLWSSYVVSGEALLFVRVGTLDDPDRLPPDVHLFTRSKQPWVILPPDIPTADEMYDFASVLPKESLARLAAAFGSSAG